MGMSNNGVLEDVDVETYDCDDCDRTFIDANAYNGHDCLRGDGSSAFERYGAPEVFCSTVLPSMYDAVLEDGRAVLSTTGIDAPMNNRRIGAHLTAIVDDEFEVPFIDGVRTESLQTRNRYHVELEAEAQCLMDCVCPDCEQVIERPWLSQHCRDHALEQYQGSVDDRV